MGTTNEQIRDLAANRHGKGLDDFLPENAGVKVGFIREIGLGAVIKNTTNSKNTTTRTKYLLLRNNLACRKYYQPHFITPKPPGPGSWQPKNNNVTH
jgi:hypothetical protein